MFTRYIYPLSLRSSVFSRIQRRFKNLDADDVKLIFGNNVRMDLKDSDFGHRCIIMTGFYELELSKIIGKIAKKSKLLFDVGANYGYYSCIWASTNNTNTVKAFEASPKNFTPLKNNIEKNDLSNQVELNSYAIGKEKGKLYFDMATSQKQTGWGGLTIGHKQGTVEVDVDTLDNYATQHSIESIDVLKIDTEGADTWVLFGAENLLKEKRIKHIFFEHNEPRMRQLNISPDEAPSFLKSLNYRIEPISSSDFYAYPQ